MKKLVLLSLLVSAFQASALLAYVPAEVAKADHQAILNTIEKSGMTLSSLKPTQYDAKSRVANYLVSTVDTEGKTLCWNYEVLDSNPFGSVIGFVTSAKPTSCEAIGSN